MSEIIATLLTALLPTLMKDEKELPLALRIFRWGAILMALAYAGLCLIEKYREVFP